MSAFDLLEEEPRPWLDADTLKAKFLKLSAPLHPDRVHHLAEAERETATRKFADLNAAYLLLREPRDRINLLIETETGSKPRDIQKIPPGTMDLFVEVGQLCRDLDGWLANRQAAETSPLLKVAAMREMSEWQFKLETIQAKVEKKDAETTEELRKVDAEWSIADRKPLLERLENLGRLFSYISRWSQQLSERAVQLAI